MLASGNAVMRVIGHWHVGMPYQQRQQPAGRPELCMAPITIAAMAPEQPLQR